MVKRKMKTEIPDYGPYHDYPSHPMGGGNPYYFCSSCGITDPQINGTLSGHGENCEWVEKKKKDLEFGKYNLVKRVLLLKCQTEMWQALYIDGTSVTQSHKICPMELLQLAEEYKFSYSDVVEAEAKEGDEEKALDWGAFPENQSELKYNYFA